MRKVTLFFLLAASAMPAIAADQQSGLSPEPERASSISDDGDSQRPSEARRSNRSSMESRPGRAERVRSGGEERQRAVASFDAQPSQPQADVRQFEGRGRQGNDSFDRRSRGSDGRRGDDGAQQQSGGQEARQWNGWQQRERRVRSVPDVNVTQRAPMTGPERPASTIERRHFDGNYSRWSQRWRNDGRYDWRRHRDRNRSTFHIGFYYDPFGWNYRRFGIGTYMWPDYYSARYWINDPWQYRLPQAYGPYRWVRYHNDALLIDTWTGEVVDVIYGFFW